MFAAAALCTDRAGFHAVGSVKDGFTSVCLSLLQHLNRCGVNALLL
jgi:hypothetical protein